MTTFHTSCQKGGVEGEPYGAGNAPNLINTSFAVVESLVGMS
jgi:hypothetical protein